MRSIIKVQFSFALLMAITILGAQSVYSNIEEGLTWLETSGLYQPVYLPVSEELNTEGLINSNLPWGKYVLTRSERQYSGLSFGLTGHYAYTNNSLRSLFNNSDLIGNGIITNIKWSQSGFILVNSMFFTDNPTEASRGYVRTIKNVAMYTNLAYLKYFYRGKNVSSTLTFGRDQLRIGHGTRSSLFISNYSRPFDQLILEVRGEKVSGLSGVIELDPIEGQTRILYIHALRFRIPKLIFTIGEVFLTADSTGGFHMANLNPLHIWSWEHGDRKENDGNGFLYSGFTWLPQKSLKLFGELIIDDVNFHHPNAFYLNRFGFLFGVQKTGAPFRTSNFFLEYSNVLNQVYQSYKPSHIYTHRGYPIGHFLGNDFDYIYSHYSQLLINERSKPYLDISYTRDGFNGLDTPFNNPWEDEKGLIPGYKPPPNPTPPVTYRFETEIGLEYSITKLQFVSVGLTYQRSTRQREKEEHWSIILRLWLNLSHGLK